MASTYNYEYFNVTFPREYVAQVEINRPQKMNAFNETYVRTSSWPSLLLHESFIILLVDYQAHVTTADMIRRLTVSQNVEGHRSDLRTSIA